MTRVRFLLLVAIVWTGCSSTQTVVKEREVTIPVQAITDTLVWMRVDTIKQHVSDTIFTAVKVVNRDTVAVVKWRTKTDTVMVWIKPDSVKYKYLDTTKVQPVQIIYEPTFWQKFLWVFVGIGILAIGIIVSILIWKLKI